MLANKFPTLSIHPYLVNTRKEKKQFQQKKFVRIKLANGSPRNSSEKISSAQIDLIKQDTTLKEKPSEIRSSNNSVSFSKERKRIFPFVFVVPEFIFSKYQKVD